MSQQNVDLVRRHLDAWEGGDPDSALRFMSEDVEFDARTRPGGRVWHGREGVREAIGEWLEIWDEYRMERGRVIDAGGDRVVSLWRESGRARRSGAPIAQEGATVFTIADGQIRSVLVSVEVEGVLAGLGLAADSGASGQD
jgi:ketosteroid isomerase-like protein